MRRISTLACTSTPWVGSSRSRTFGSVAASLATTTFCWLPPLRLSTNVLVLGVTMPSFSTKPLHEVALLAAIDHAQPVGEPADDRHADVVTHAADGHDAQPVAVARQVGQPLLEGMAGGVGMEGLAVERDLALAQGLERVEASCQVARAAALEAGQAHDLAGVEREVHVLVGARSAQALDLQHRLADALTAPAARTAPRWFR